MKHGKFGIVCASLILLLCAGAARAGAAGELEQSFQNPPPAARPWVYWFPLNGNLTEEGITADLEAMERVGIGGLLYMEVDQGAPKGEADFAGPIWMDRIGHAIREAKRLGLEINMNNDAGWNGSGGPWITPELSMQVVVWSELTVDAATTAPLVLPQPKAERDYYEDIAVLAMPAPATDLRIEGIVNKSSASRGGIQNSAPLPAGFTEAAADAVIARDRVIDLTGKMDRDGHLDWTAPAGRWLVMRFGHTTTGRVNHPAPITGMGLECDKLSKAAATFHFENLMGKVVAQNRALTGQDQALVGVHIDSWENGAQNWTPGMREEFQQRRGYDLFPFLPAFAGRIVDSTEVTERFLWDLRQTVSDLLIENYAGTFRDLAHKNGLRLTIEAYGEPADDMKYAGVTDEPMGEFWAWARFGAANSCTQMASAAHTYGKPIVGAEAFTATNAEKWQGHPGNIKDLGDWAFCEGINRFVFHRYAAQPWLNVAPGMSMGPWGLHYERTQTWWEQSKAWHAYLTRCQSLLQQGLFVADIAYLAPEGAPREFHAPSEAEIAPHIRGGYGFDGCSAEVVMTRMSVKDGRIVLPDGMSYRVLVVPPVETMTPALLDKIQALADAGATIVGGATPPRKSPSLADLGAGDAQLEKTAAALWASGKILTGKTAQQVLADRGVPADFSASPFLRWIHRRIGDAEVYFVANPQADHVEALADFRIAGRQPELWWPDSGRMEACAAFQERDGVTRVHLNLEPNGSVFVIFRKPSAGIDPVVALKQDGQLLWNMEAKPLTALQIVKASYGVPGDPQRLRDVTRKVQNLVDTGTREFSVASLAQGDDPAYGIVKTLTVEYTAGGQSHTATGTDPEMVSLRGPGTPPPDVAIQGTAKAPAVLMARQAGRYTLQTASGATRTVAVPALPAAQNLAGPWQVRFDPKAGGPGEVTFATLEDWSKRPEEGIKYYSGTAVYRTAFEVPALPADAQWMLDLGAVEVMAEVKLNGKDLGILWKAPYRVDVTPALQAGTNRLELKVVNLWINRQIGDEHLPEDGDRNADPTKNAWNDRNQNGTLKAWPEWLQQGKPNPAGRISFTSWRLWGKDDPLSPSGLLGPVTLEAWRPGKPE